MIKAVVFDLGGVVFTNGFKRFVKYLMEEYSLDDKKILELLDGELGTSYRLGKINKEDFWKKIFKELSIEADIDELEQEWISGYILIEETKQIILDLSKKYKIYYLSDGTPTRAKLLQDKYNFLDLFEDGIISHQVGFKKPSPEIYQALLKKVNLLPKEILFIDDKQSNLPPAQDLGIQTLLFITPEDLKEKLKNLKLL